MRQLVAGLVAGAVLATAAGAGAVSARQEGPKLKWGLITCNAEHLDDGTPVVVCLRSNGTGLAIGITNQQVMVVNQAGRSLFHKWQP